LDAFFQVNGDKLEVFLAPGVPGRTVGQALVGDRSILPWFARYVVNVALQCIRIYGPLHLVWAALRLPGKTPLSVIVANTARSTAFLTSYVSALMAMLLLHSHLVGGMPPRWQLHCWTWVAGFSVLLERSNRQAELAYFCAAHALNSVYNHAKRLNLVRPNNLIGVLLLSLATGQIMKHNAERPGRTMHLLFGELRGRKSQVSSQKFDDDKAASGDVAIAHEK
jgi:hypothetical protein